MRQARRPFVPRVTLAIRLRLWLAAAALGLSAASSASAQKSPPAPSAPAPTAAPLVGPGEASGADAAAKQRARTVYERGARAYDEGRYHAAADAFLEADRIFPTPELCFNVAKAYEKLGHESGALRYYREYLRRSENAPDAEETNTRVRELEKALAARGVQQVTVLSTPRGATVSLDGQPVGVTPWTGETYPGRHRLALSLAGHATSDDLIEVETHRAADVGVTLTPVLPPRAGAAPREDRREQVPRVSALTWTALGTGTAALGAALAIEMAQGENRGISRTGAFFTGMGVAASALGGVLLYVDLSRDASESP